MPPAAPAASPSPDQPAPPGPPPPARPHAPGKPPSRRWRPLPWIAGGILVGLIALGLWPRPQPAEIATASRGALTVTVDDEGMTRVKHRYTVSAPVAGLLRRIDWKAGAPVVAGETVLAVLETRDADFLDARSRAQAEARVAAARAAREVATAQRGRAQAAADLARTDGERQRQLFAQHALSAQEFDAATQRERAAAEELRAAVFAQQIAEHDLRQAEVLLQRTPIRPEGQGPAPGPGGPTQAAAFSVAQQETPLVLTSPVSGRILRVLQESARVVPAGFPLVEVGDPTDLETRIEVLSRDGVMVRPGARVWLEQWGGPQPLEARVRLVEPSAFTKISALGVEEQRVYVIADFVDPLARRPTLGDNYRVEARIVVWESPSVLKVPSGALFQRGQTWQTYVLDGRTARLRTVQPGHTNGRETEILAGLQEGDRVVVYPGDTLNDGTAVRPTPAAER